MTGFFNNYTATANNGANMTD